MKFDCVKTENCFADSRTYEYTLPVTGEELFPRLAGWEARKNLKLRRPVLAAERNGVRLKGVLEYRTLRVSFPTEGWETEKAEFEKWLEGLE